MKDKDIFRIVNIQRLSVSDGPGIRTVVFFKGCTLKCPWCCNPEAIHYNKDLFYNNGNCIFPKDSIVCNNCEKKGGTNSTLHCPINAFEPTYIEYSKDEFTKTLLKDIALYASGGITFSGGEPLLSLSDAEDILKELKKNNVHVAIETALYVNKENVEKVIKYIDYWIVDLKYQFGYFENQDYIINRDSLSINLSLLRKNVNKHNILYRMVMMKEALERLDNIIFLLKKTNISEIEILPYHSLAAYKYEKLGKHHQLFNVLSKNDMEYIYSRFGLADIKILNYERKGSFY